MAQLGVGLFLKSLLDRDVIIKIATNPEAAFSAIAAKLKLQQKPVQSANEHMLADHAYAHLSTLAERGQVEMHSATLMLDGARVTLLIFAEPAQIGKPAATGALPASSAVS